MLITRHIMLSVVLLTLLLPSICVAFHVQPHPLEPKCAYVSGLTIPVQDESTKADLLTQFKKTPLMIFTKQQRVSPIEFQDFLTIFDSHCDKQALLDPESHLDQVLQPFDFVPGLKHIAPRGNFKATNWKGVESLHVKPVPPFIDNHVWHCDLHAHATKIPNVVTGFQVLRQPLYGANTDFVSGTTIHDHLNPHQKKAASQILMEISRAAFLDREYFDYGGVNILSDVREDLPVTQVPLLVGSDADPCVILQPTFTKRIVGMNHGNSAQWVRNFMIQHVLPHRFTVQWKAGDIGVFNNRQFMHSSTPATHYLNFAGANTRLLLQVFLPTTRQQEFTVYPEDAKSLLLTDWCKLDRVARAVSYARRNWNCKLPNTVVCKI